MKNRSKITRIALATALLLPACGQMEAWSWGGVAKTVWKYKETAVGAGIGAGLKACYDRRIQVGGENGNLRSVLFCGAVGGAVGFAWSYFQKSEHEKTRAEVRQNRTAIEGLQNQVVQLDQNVNEKIAELTRKLEDVSAELADAIAKGNEELRKQLQEQELRIKNQIQELNFQNGRKLDQILTILRKR